jgi:CTP:molybdopterin cytidylyltransferase MocA
MSASLRFGLAQVPAQAPAALIMLVDQPAVSIADLKSLIAAWRARPALAAAAWYASDIGAPCILPRNLFEQAAALQGDRGAKPLLQTLEELTRVPMPAAEFDIDTAEDLARATAVVAIETTRAQG